jgi:glycosyltransferase involved in cell wall biosynthesis
MADKHIVIATGIFAPDIGGPASYARTLATRLAKSGPVTVVTYSSVRRSPEDSTLPFKVVRVWSRWPKGVKHLLYLAVIFKHARHSSVVFALNAISAGLPARLAARFHKKKFIVKIVGDAAWERAINSNKTSLMLNDFQKSKKGGWINVLHTAQFQICKGAHAIIVPSEYLADIVAGWGIPPQKIKAIYNGVDFVPAELSKEEARKKLNISGNILFSWGRLVPWKGFRMLIKIMPQLMNINQFFRLVIVGDGPDRPTLETMIRNLGLERKVWLMGRKKPSEVADYLAASDMALLNSGYEGFSHQILEAMTAGVPVVASASGGNREVIHQGENGFMVKYNDEFNLVEAVRTIWNSSEMRERFIQGGKETVAHFTADKMFEETIDVLTHA